MRNKVLKALEKNGYVPNQVARSLKKRSTNTVGIIIPDISEEFFSGIIGGIDEIVMRHGYSIIFSDSKESALKEDHYLRLLFQKRIDALVIATVAKENAAMRLYLENQIPVVFIDNLPHLDTSYDAVLIDNAKASQLVVQHLAGLGHRGIAIISGSPDETTGYERLEGYRRSLARLDIPLDEKLIKLGNYKEDSGYQCMQELLSERDRYPFTAIYVTASKMAFGAIKAIRENRLRIPEDISFVGFDFNDKTGLVTPGITTITQPERQIGNIVGDLIIKRIKEKDSPQQGGGSIMNQRILLEPELMVRESVKQLSGE
jgi:DNA-binding LacI/PurR family transcriptional regulator